MALPVASILIFSGAATALAGAIAFLAPRRVFRLAFAAEPEGAPTLFLARHWGVLLFVLGALIVWSAYAPAARGPILAAAALEKFVAVLMLLLGLVKPTPVLTATLAADGIFAVFYVAVIAGFIGA
jgi:hypothetical protein